MRKQTTFEEYINNVGLEKFADEYNRVVEILYAKGISELAEEGWIIPSFVNWFQIKTLEPLNSNRDKLIKGWIHQYTENGIEILNDIVKDCPEKWKTVLNECVECYLNGRYQICIPALVTIYEGMLSHKVYGLEPKQIHYVGALETNLQQNNYVGVDFILALSVKEFTKRFFMKRDFTLDEPIEINRHWVAHGRSNLSADNLTVMKLFNAVSTVMYLNNKWAEIYSEKTL
ncbi:hypothetical protein A6E10_18345 [Aliivibrio fischeri]|nr:hypothetical protein A6E10_18345 [Aliivibrio fischeri]